MFIYYLGFTMIDLALFTTLHLDNGLTNPVWLRHLDANWCLVVIWSQKKKQKFRATLPPSLQRGDEAIKAARR